MFSVKLFTNRTLIQAINYFNHNNLVKADDLNSDTTLTPLEKSSLFFSAFVKQKTFSSWKSQDIFSNMSDEGDESYVSVATFDSRIMNVGLFEDNKFSRVTLEVWTQNTSENTSSQILKEPRENIKIDFCKTLNNLNYLLISITKNTFKKILDFLKENENCDNTRIFLKWSEEEDTGLCLLQIRIAPYEILHMYWPQAAISETMINDFQSENSLTYSENHKESFMYTIDFLSTEIDGNNPKISQIDNKLNLHIDEMPTMFLYRSTEIPELQFFDKFNIKIRPYDERNSREKVAGNFKSQPSVLLEFSKKNADSGYYIDLQITEYKYDVNSDLYLLSNENRDILYKSIDFNSMKITFQQASANLYTTIQTPKTTPVIEMYFVKKGDGLFYELEAYETLGNSISEIIISFFGKNKPIIIDKNSVKINNDNKNFSIKLEHTIFSSNENLSIKSILENGKGIFKISVMSNTDTIIESTVCLDNNKMATLSTNRLLEHFEKLGFKNGGEEFQSPESSPTKENISLSNIHKKVDTEASQRTATSSENKSNTSEANSSNTSDANSPQGNVSVKSESGNNKLPIVVFFSTKRLINTQRSQEKNNINSKNKITGTRTSDDPTKSISDT